MSATVRFDPILLIWFATLTNILEVTRLVEFVVICTDFLSALDLLLLVEVIAVNAYDRSALGVIALVEFVAIFTDGG